MEQSQAESWQAAFFKVVKQPENCSTLRESALQERLGDWTKALTVVVVETCKDLGWQASAKGHLLEILPAPRNEYLALDVMAFDASENRWRFPVAVVELENSRDDDRIAYSLWKVLCVRACLRVVFCYRRSPDEASALVRFLREEIVNSMDLRKRVNLEGETLVVVGSRDESETFPYGFFKWWRLDENIGKFNLF